MLDDRLHRKRLNNRDTPAWPSGLRAHAPQRTPRLADQLYAQLVNQIGGGTLMPGQRLPSENRLSSEFGVSRPVIREAIARLQADGLVTTRHGSGTFVVGPSKDRAIKLAPIAGTPALVLCFELRTALECETAILAAKRWARPCLEAIEAALEESDRDAGISLRITVFTLRSHGPATTPCLRRALTVLLGHLSAGIRFAPTSSAWLSGQARVSNGASTRPSLLQSACATRGRRVPRCGIT